LVGALWRVHFVVTPLGNDRGEARIAIFSNCRNNRTFFFSVSAEEAVYSFHVSVSAEEAVYSFRVSVSAEEALYSFHVSVSAEEAVCSFTFH
jgi:hypothetical protein